MTELFLIAHKVRGEPAFDVAERLQIGEELGWIIPTSGHRAYPYWVESLANRRFIREDEGGIMQGRFIEEIAGDMPPDLRDHYAALPAAPTERKLTTLDLADLGL
jgi:hypothetical protein